MNDSDPVFRFSPVATGMRKDVFRFRWRCGCVYQQSRDGSDVQSLPCAEHAPLLSGSRREAQSSNESDLPDPARSQDRS